MKRKTKKNYKGYMSTVFSNSETITQEEKNEIKEIISSNVKHLDDLLEEHLVSILFRDKKLDLPDKKQKNIITVAKQIYFQG